MSLESTNRLPDAMLAAAAEARPALFAEFRGYLTDEFFNVLDERLGEASNSSLSIRA